ncbi:hypothetical protein HNR23_003493 [Nocardiopsis mwathae]|uniref:DUF6542 domain-containing protein n=1 Tax=Nocardiopsis mwathae TaxID=1472723 RepID=A0A7X0D6L3_9ACTN|nr:DUF6542 domain-containing protein [Nocardiopsis mwathae]MBB6173433.1 hypothetical protein [Nocardiopsis mwathae]
MVTRNTETPEDPRPPFFVDEPSRRRRPSDRRPPGGAGASATRTLRSEAGAAAPPAKGRRSGGGTARPHPAQPGRAGVRLTARGGILGIVVLSFASAMIAPLVGMPGINGGAFVAACVVAALLVRPTDLLSLSVSPPLAYFTAILAAEAVLTLGEDGFARGVAIGIATRLADIAPWLFLGTALVLIIALFRGLPANVRDLGDELNGRKERAARRAERHPEAE